MRDRQLREPTQTLTSCRRRSRALWTNCGSASSGRQTSQKSNSPAAMQASAMTGSGRRTPNATGMPGSNSLARRARGFQWPGATSRPIELSGASCQPTVILSMSMPASAAMAIPSKHSSSVLPPHWSISSAPLRRTTSGCASPMASLVSSNNSRMKRARFWVEPPYSSVR